MSVSLDEYLSQYPELQAIAEEKSALDVQAEEMRPSKDEDLQECSKVLGKLYTVFTIELPPLIEREKRVKTEAISAWKERQITGNAGIEEIASGALNQVEVNTLRDLLATRIKANEVSLERFNTLQIMAIQLKAQGEKLLEQAQQVTPSTEAKLLADQKTFNKFGAFIQSEQEWVVAHPPIKKEAVIEEWKMNHPQTELIEQALKSYHETYE